MKTMLQKVIDWSLVRGVRFSKSAYLVYSRLWIIIYNTANTHTHTLLYKLHGIDFCIIKIYD